MRDLFLFKWGIITGLLRLASIRLLILFSTFSSRLNLGEVVYGAVYLKVDLGMLSLFAR